MVAIQSSEAQPHDYSPGPQYQELHHKNSLNLHLIHLYLSQEPPHYS